MSIGASVEGILGDNIPLWED